ncbi:hypothetical protein ACNVED_16885 (plasmid) [Legionella sp. D16C41]|uniref:hypothetical protein n=1 Tax=Legionella sp. D16C41 TaxID=3402688 RepID=UPI003AF9F47E
MFGCYHYCFEHGSSALKVTFLYDKAQLFNTREEEKAYIKVLDIYKDEQLLTLSDLPFTEQAFVKYQCLDYLNHHQLLHTNYLIFIG